MPRRKKDTESTHIQSDAETERANGANRAGVIKATYLKLRGLEAKRKELGAEIAALKAENVKGVLGMKIGDFNIAVRLAGLEGDDRDTCIDTMRETFAALGIGGQLNWLDAASDAPKTEAVRKPRQKKTDVVSPPDNTGSYVGLLRDTATDGLPGHDDEPDPFGGPLEETFSDAELAALGEEADRRAMADAFSTPA